MLAHSIYSQLQSNFKRCWAFSLSHLSFRITQVDYNINWAELHVFLYIPSAASIRFRITGQRIEWPFLTRMQIKPEHTDTHGVLIQLLGFAKQRIPSLRLSSQSWTLADVHRDVSKACTDNHLPDASSKQNSRPVSVSNQSNWDMSVSHMTSPLIPSEVSRLSLLH